MPETTLRGVTLVTKSRRKGDGAFDISISPKGVQILRPGEEARLLEWDSGVHLEDRSSALGSVLLILRGGGRSHDSS